MRLLLPAAILLQLFLTPDAPSVRAVSMAAPLPGRAAHTEQETVTFDLTDAGFVPAWLVAGPFEQPLVGFGEAVDADVIGEAAIMPVAGRLEETTLVEGGTVAWKPLHARPSGFVDFNAAMGWVRPGDAPEKVWKAKAGYAFAYVDSPAAQNVLLKLGSNSSVKVMLNGEAVHAGSALRNADPDSDSVPLRLHPGRNTLLVKVGQTHRNEAPGFFGEIRYEWGFYARLLGAEGRPAEGLKIQVPTGAAAPGIDVISTFFFKEGPGGLQQRLDLLVTSYSAETRTGSLRIQAGEVEHEATLERVPFGESRHPIYLPEITEETPAAVLLDLGSEVMTAEAVLLPQPHYEIHLAMMSHTDIGYTNTQPVVKERHLSTLDDVLERCERDSSFAWTIETIWQLEQYRLGRSPERFGRLMDLVKEGRIAVSPVYTNPYTGWVSEEELIRAFDKGKAYASEFGLKFGAAIYNDVPGLSWLMPQVLEEAGVSLLVTGLNEVYSGYALQRSLPKVFSWEGVGGSRVLTYRTEAYNEGQTLGLEKGVEAVPYRLWERLHRLRAQGYPYDLVLAVHTFADNGPIPFSAPATTAAWNAEYAYPRITVSSIDAFGDAFQARYRDFPVVAGDWTSTWDVLYQGEPARMVRQRWTQHNLLTAEKMATLSWLLDPWQDPLTARVGAAYDDLLHFSGHGSGLEYGYGSPADNLLTMAYREQYVQDATLAARGVLERAAYRLSAREESFEGEALYVFNALNWMRDTPVEVEFPRENAHAYRAIDPETQEAIPSRYAGHTLRLVARSVPPIGYRKIRLERISQADPQSGSGLLADSCAIENAYYRITGDCAAGKVAGILDRESGRELIYAAGGTPFSLPLRADSLNAPSFTVVGAEEVSMYVRDESPARLTLVTERPGHLFARSEYTLWESLDRVDVQHTVDLETLEFPDQVQEYAVAFPFALPDGRAAIDILGGFLDAEEDRFPGMDHDAFSVRRGIGVHTAEHTVSWAAADSRVVRVRRNAAGGAVILANVVNNFPEAWNRWEENKGLLDFRFSFTSREGAFEPAATSRFGWEINTPPVVRYTWLRSEPASESFVTVEGESVVVLALRSSRDMSGVVLRLMNMDPKAPAEARISSPLFDVRSGKRVTMFEDGGISLPFDGAAALVALAPGEVQTLTFSLPPR